MNKKRTEFLVLFLVIISFLPRTFCIKHKIKIRFFIIYRLTAEKLTNKIYRNLILFQLHIYIYTYLLFLMVSWWQKKIDDKYEKLFVSFFVLTSFIFLFLLLFSEWIDYRTANWKHHMPKTNLSGYFLYIYKEKTQLIEQKKNRAYFFR